MTLTPRLYPSFAESFAMAYAEEISGESYFAALSAAEPDPRCAALWAKLALIEQRTHTIMHPLAAALGVLPADRQAEIQSGIDQAAAWTSPWLDKMRLILRDYPAYVTEFETLKSLAPPEMQSVAQLLIDHEVAMVGFARLELAGDPDPGAPLDTYLAHVSTWTPR